ncbi:MAG: hypothetical protein BGO14_00420 [Chlamydiales bacterium 38-26]|nr:DUF2177 family protein [Chlamydiales bacterium]OJV07189.1 MAG: hypothetical protein BGO14_00420 [Chlamydiales bacterium 38-26]
MTFLWKKSLLIIFCFFSVIILDVIWFNFLGNIYEAAYEPIKSEFNTELTSDLLVASLSIYLLIALAIVFFVLPRVNHLDNTQTFFWGGFLGLLVYGVYDLTNYVIFAKWPLRIALMDICWGFLIFGLTTLGARLIMRLMDRR